MAKDRPRTGGVVEKNGSWYLRYRPQRGGKDVWVRLARKDDYTRYSEAVALANRVLDTTGWQRSAAQRPAPNKLITEYIDDVFLPLSKEEHRDSTHAGYVYLINYRLRGEFKGKRFCDYAPSDASRFLSELARTLNEHSISKLRSLMTMIFSHATSDGYLVANPMRDARLKRKPRPVKPTQAYTVEQMRQILAVLKGRERVFMLLAILGLRPSEIIALTWSDIDFDKGVLFVRRSGWKGKAYEGGKTHSEHAVTIGPTAVAILATHRAQPRFTDFVVESAKGTMAKASVVAAKARIAIEKAGIPWYAAYACRRGASTKRHDLAGGNSQHVAGEFGHSLETANQYYVKPIPEAQRVNALQYDALLAFTEHAQNFRETPRESDQVKHNTTLLLTSGVDAQLNSQ